ncbi:MAG: hypothetical protein LIO46_03490 [Clostridiales bacterium]|nr:hypothetical protein [Clostridiales bacterium]
MSKRAVKRPAAMLLCACLVLALLGSAAVMTAHAGHHHDCVEEQCPVCACITRAGDQLRQGFAPGVGAGFGMAAFLAAGWALLSLFGGRMAGAGTLVGLKIQLNQ